MRLQDSVGQKGTRLGFFNVEIFLKIFFFYVKVSTFFKSQKNLTYIQMTILKFISQFFAAIA